MTNQKKMLVVFLGSILSVTAVAQKDDPMAMIINHFDHPLSYTIGINPQVLPDFPENFILSVNDQKESRVLDLNKEAYIRVIDPSDSKKSSFFGIERNGSNIMYHGYISKGIAYSWKKNVITFCTPEEYKKQKHC